MGETMAIRSASQAVEVAWFSALCSDDYEFLGVPDGSLRSSFEHCANIVRAADRLGYQNILLPSSYQVGQDPLVFAAGASAFAERISLLVAIRAGEVHPPMLARAIASLDHMLHGRLTLNLISSDLPGETVDSARRYRRSREVLEILKQAWTQDEIRIDGEFYKLQLGTDPVKPYQQHGGPLLYFGGISPDAQDLCAEHCDVFLMWPETEARLADTMAGVLRRAASYGRTVDFGLRIHVIVRETEAEAQAFARRLVSKLDDAVGRQIKERAQDAASAGVLRQDELRQHADDEGYIEPHVWSGIGRARSGCGSAIVGDPDQVLRKIERYRAMGIRSFILSGYPHRQECELFARYVLPRIPTVCLARSQGRIPDAPPVTPLTTGVRR